LLLWRANWVVEGSGGAVVGDEAVELAEVEAGIAKMGAKTTSMSSI
jgi:hypothetical protein